MTKHVNKDIPVYEVQKESGLGKVCSLHRNILLLSLCRMKMKWVMIHMFLTIQKKENDQPERAEPEPDEPELGEPEPEEPQPVELDPDKPEPEDPEPVEPESEEPEVGEPGPVEMSNVINIHRLIQNLMKHALLIDTEPQLELPDPEVHGTVESDASDNVEPGDASLYIPDAELQRN